jgi:hypothetical protein
MTYSTAQYLNAENLLLGLYNMLRSKKTNSLPTSEQLKEPLRIAEEAFCLLEKNNENWRKTLGKVVRALYEENRPVSS